MKRRAWSSASSRSSAIGVGAASACRADRGSSGRARRSRHNRALRPACRNRPAGAAGRRGSGSRPAGASGLVMVMASGTLVLSWLDLGRRTACGHAAPHSASIAPWLFASDCGTKRAYGVRTRQDVNGGEGQGRPNGRRERRARPLDQLALLPSFAFGYIHSRAPAAKLVILSDTQASRAGMER